MRVLKSHRSRGSVHVPWLVLEGGKLLLRSGVVLMLLFAPLQGVFAVEVPPPGVPTFIQTNGPNAPLGRGDWYTNNANGVAAGYHYFEINVPCNWPATTPVYLDLFSPEINQNAITSGFDEINDNTNSRSTNFAFADDTMFELYPPGTLIGPVPNIPAPGTGIPGTLQTFPPSTAPESWVRFYTISAPVTCGTYVLRAQTGVNDENGWRLRVGSDDDADPNNAPPPNYDNPDGIGGSNDEITIGLTQTSYQHEVPAPPPNPADQCLTLYQFVEFGAATVPFHNFDLDNNQRVRYYAPSAAYDPTASTGGIVGTVSGQTTWNGGTQTSRGTGDVIPNPEPGWWRIVTCVNDDNQYIQEGITGRITYFQQPPTPVMTVGKDDGQLIVQPGQVLTYTIQFTNTSNATATPGAALNVVLTDTLPVGTTFVGCAINAPFGGTCAENPSGVVTFSINNTVNAGDGGSVQVVAQVDTNAPPGSITNTVTLGYEDGLGNHFPPESATDVDVIPQASIAVRKTAMPISVPEPGGVVTFTVQITNTGAQVDVVINTLTDSIHGDLNGQGTCSVPQTILAGGVYTCQFPATVSGSPGDAETDIVTAGGFAPSTEEPVGGSDDATVTVADVPSSIAVNKVADPPQVSEPGGTVNFTVTISNTSVTDALTITSLLDDIHGDLNGQGTCSVPQVLAVGGVYTCQFPATVSGAAGDAETDTVTADGVDDDGGSVGGSDDATVTIVPPPPAPAAPQITLQKDNDANGDLIFSDVGEIGVSGITVPYRIIITNTGTVSITTLNVTDTLPSGFAFVPGSASPVAPAQIGNVLLWNNLTGGDPFLPGDHIQVDFSASVTTSITGTYTNVAEALGVSPGGNATATDDTPVSVTDPSVALSKQIVPPGMVNGVITYTIQLTNTGPSMLDVLPVRDTFTGPITYVGGTPLADTVDNVVGVLEWLDLTTSPGYGNLAPGQSAVITTVFSLITPTTTYSITNLAVVSGTLDVYGNQANRDEDTAFVSNVPTAVDLLYFNATSQSDGIMLGWATVVELDNYGWRLLRSVTGNRADAMDLNVFIPAAGHGASGAAYSHLDQDVVRDETYTYWLVDVDIAGNETEHGPVTVTFEQAVDAGTIYRVYLPFIVK